MTALLNPATPTSAPDTTAAPDADATEHPWHRGHVRSPLLQAIGALSPGVRRVARDVEDYGRRWQQANRSALAGSGPLWAVLGDSLTQSIGASCIEHGWVGWTHRRLAAAGRDYRIVNLSVSGDRTADLLEGQLPTLAALPQSPDLVTVMIGANDLLRVWTSRRTAVRIETALWQLPPGAVVTTLPALTPVAMLFNRVVADVAAQRDLVVADLSQRRTARWWGLLADDHFHPDDRGYARLGDVVAEALLRRGFAA